MYGWYSVKQAKLIGTVEWTTPDGKTVEVTMVSKDKKHYTKWDDISCVGEVVKFVRKLTFGHPIMEEEIEGWEKLSRKELIAKTDQLGKVIREVQEQEKQGSAHRWN